MLKVAICDETLSRSEQLAGLVRGGVAGVAVDCYSAPAELRRAIKKDPGKYRLVITETGMGPVDGIALARELRALGYVWDIVFCTSDPARAGEAYGVFPTGYILKPCSADELCRVVSFVAERHAKKASIILNGTDGRKNGFCVDDIIYIEVFRTELEVHCVGGKTTCVGSLREVCEKLPGERFYRSHRSFIVNLGRVSRIEKYQYTMDNGDVVAVAKNRYAEAKQAWRDFCD